MGDEREGGHEQDEDRGAVLRVPVDLPGHPDQAEETRRLEQPDERRGLQACSKENGVSLRGVRRDDAKVAIRGGFLAAKQKV